MPCASLTRVTAGAHFGAACSVAGAKLDEDNRWLEIGSAGDFDAAITADVSAQVAQDPEVGQVPALPPGADDELRERYRLLQEKVHDFLDRHSQIDQPITDDMLRNFMDDPALDISWTQGVLHDLEAVGRLRRNPDGEGYYPVS